MLTRLHAEADYLPALRPWSPPERLGPVPASLAVRAQAVLERHQRMAAELTRLGRDPTVERRLGDDHGFGGPGHGHAEGFREVFGHVLDWWLGAG